MGWLSSWSYRKTVTITGQSGAGTDYQVNLSIGNAAGGDFNLESHCTSFPNDIQVTDNDQTTPLDYWVEDLTVDPISMWVEVADDLGSNVDICVYYGKSGESSASDGRNTFIVWDDFDGGSEQWTEVDDGGYITIDRVTNHRINITTLDCDSENEYVVIDKGSDIGNYVYQFTALRDTVVPNGEVAVGTSDTLASRPWVNWNDGMIAITLQGVTYDRHILQTVSEGSGANAADNTAFSEDTPYYYDLIRDGDDLTLNVWTDSARTNSLLTISTTVAGLTNQRYIYAATNGESSGTWTGWIDDIIIRKYNSPEPAYLSAGSEESAPTGAIMNQFQGANIGADLYNGALIAA